VATITMKRGDTRPKIVRQLMQTVNGVETIITLTAATQVKFLLKDPGSSATGGGVCSITNAAQGEVTYTPVGSDTSVTRTWQFEYEITWNDGGIETVPNGDPVDYYTLEIKADLG
jgi:hypothetical protein